MMTRDALCCWTQAAGAGRWTLNLSVAARLDMTYQTLVCSLGMKDVEPATPIAFVKDPVAVGPPGSASFHLASTATQA